MTFEGRIHRLEASLTAKEKFALWLHRAKADGGFLPYWEKELKGPLAPFEWFEDEEAYLLIIGIFADDGVDDDSVRDQALVDDPYRQRRHRYPCSSHFLQARFSRLVTCTKYSAGLTSSTSLTS